MADTFRRSVGDQATYGYRQLPSVGSEGPDLKTLICAGFGVALGILVGTVMADGSWRALNPLAQHHVAQASSSRSGPSDRSPAKTAQPPPLQAQSTTHGSPQPSVGLQSPAVRASADRNAPAVRKASVTGNAAGAGEASDVRKASGTRKASVARSVPGAHRVLASHRRRPVHGLAARRRHFARRSALRRHRLRAPGKAAIRSALPPADRAFKHDDLATPFAFMVEGELTLSGYDALTGTIETYEGETFALHKAESASSDLHSEGFSPNIHYRCDPLGSCTLIAGQFVLNAQRTR